MIIASDRPRGKWPRRHRMQIDRLAGGKLRITEIDLATGTRLRSRVITLAEWAAFLRQFAAAGGRMKVVA